MEFLQFFSSEMENIGKEWISGLKKETTVNELG